MVRYISLLLCIGFALGQIKVKSRHDLKPFEILGDGTYSVTSFLLSGYWECVNNDCELVMFWKERFSKKPKVMNTIEDIEILIDGLNTVMNYDFNENDTEIEYELRTITSSNQSSELNKPIIDLISSLTAYGKLYRKKNNNIITLSLGRNSLVITDAKYFINEMENWRKQKPK